MYTVELTWKLAKAATNSDANQIPSIRIAVRDIENTRTKVTCITMLFRVVKIVAVLYLAGANVAFCQHTAPLSAQRIAEADSAALSALKRDSLLLKVQPKELTDIGHSIVYPETERRAQVEGAVLLSALVSTTGNVVRIDVEEGENPDFILASKNAMLQTKFRPAIDKKGRKVAAWITRKIRFKLLLSDQ